MLGLKEDDDFRQQLVQMYQCVNGHLLCETCLSRLLADSRLRNVETTCPFCRIPLSFQTVSRNRIAEEILCLLEVECTHCQKPYSYDQIVEHEKTCGNKPVSCIFHILGCKWTGDQMDLPLHNEICSFYTKPAKDLQFEIKAYVARRIQERELNTSTLRLFSKRLAFVDFQLNAHRTDEYISRLFFKSGNISALGKTFSVKIWVGGINPHYPTVGANRFLDYQINLRGGRSNHMQEGEILQLDHILVTPPPGRYRIKPKCYRDTLSLGHRVGMKCKLDMDMMSVNLILAHPSIILRLYMIIA